MGVQFSEWEISNWSDLEADDVGVEGVEEAAERAVLRHPRPQPVHVVRHYLHHLHPVPQGVTHGRRGFEGETRRSSRKRGGDEETDGRAARGGGGSGKPGTVQADPRVVSGPDPNWRWL